MIKKILFFFLILFDVLILFFLMGFTASGQHAVSTLCGSSSQGNPLSGPDGVCISPDGNFLYAVDYAEHRIKKITIAGGASVNIAGTGTAGYNDGAAMSAQFSYPKGIKISSDGLSLFIADNGNCLIRKINLNTNTVSTIAGVSNAFAFADSSIGQYAMFNQPLDMAIAGDSLLYISDSENHVIRKLNLNTTAVTTIAGSPGNFGTLDGTGSAARFHTPNGLSLSPNGQTLYVADAGNHKIRKINLSNNLVSTLAGTGSSGSADNPVGTLASFNIPQGVCVMQGETQLYVMDTYNSTIRSIDLVTTAVTTVAGGTSTTGSHFADNANGLLAKLWYPVNAALSLNADKLYISDQQNFRIRTMMTDAPVAAEEIEQIVNSSLVIYPNPATSELAIESSEFGDNSQLAIFNTLGEKVFDQQLSAKNQQQIINVSRLTSGIYFIRFTHAKATECIRFLKK